MHVIGLLVVFLPVTVRSSGVPWYPYMMPIYTTANHHHTTHLVTHPIVHTKVLILPEGDPHHHLRHNHLRQYGPHQVHGHEQVHFPPSSYQWSPLSANAITFPRSASHNVQLRYNNYPEDYSKFKYGYQKDGNHYSDRDVKYSLPVEKSPWKPIPNILKYIPNGYVPLNYLGLDAERVSSVVKTALNEIDKDQADRYPTLSPRFPTGIQDLIGHPVKPNREIYRGAVFYDEDDPTGGGWHGSSTSFIRTKPTSKHIGKF